MMSQSLDVSAFRLARAYTASLIRVEGAATLGILLTEMLFFWENDVVVAGL